MPGWIEVILNILIVVVMLGVLIAIHEAGHLATAKMFRVYCFEYSVGMGPKLFSKKRKNGETYFSLRGIPFGGYVAMYGESGAVPEGFEEPPEERSLNAIAKWKKCIILGAGVTLNFVLGLILIYIGDSAFPMYYSGRRGIVDANNNSMTVTLDTESQPEILQYIDGHKKVNDYLPQDYVVSMPTYHYAHQTQFGVEVESVNLLAWDIHFYANINATVPMVEQSYVAVYSPASVVESKPIAESVLIFPASTDPVPAELQAFGVTKVPQIYDAQGNLNKYNFANSPVGMAIDLPLTFVPKQARRDYALYQQTFVQGDGTLPSFRLQTLGKDLVGVGVTTNVIQEWSSFTEGWQRWAQDVPTACGAVVKGFASLFMPNGWKNLSGVVGITAAMPQIKAAGGARMVFFYAGMISINLAFFNLLPFPGLDGWQLLVTAIEGITKKKVPQKAQTIVSLIGIALLIGLMVAITVKDIIALV